MAYSLEIAEELNKVFNKLAKKDKVTFKAIHKKVNEILENPYHYKPLRAPMQNHENSLNFQDAKKALAFLCI